ncbi:protein dj-1beta [Sitophilus oryzae]|uniref:Protein dj-1beta n=1 Tax=Sitophilus oryzae TaxID=7048 RepID=A0A6J2X320_SITOR|nr:protein dj-1beta [Sitophilus oryzae]
MFIIPFRSLTPVLQKSDHIFTQILSKSSSQQNMVKKALVFLAPGAEEMEFVIAVDVLRRGGVDVTVAGIPDSNVVKCSRDVYIKPDIGVAQSSAKGPYDVVVLPGGLGGSKAMAESQEVGNILKNQECSGGLIAAICAAPTVLKAHGIAEGKELTSYPAMKAQLEEGGKYKYSECKVVVDGNLITSRGPGTAFDFALTVVDQLVGKDKAVEVAKAMLLDY